MVFPNRVLNFDTIFRPFGNIIVKYIPYGRKQKTGYYYIFNHFGGDTKWDV